MAASDAEYSAACYECLYVSGFSESGTFGVGFSGCLCAGCVDSVSAEQDTDLQRDGGLCHAVRTDSEKAFEGFGASLCAFGRGRESALGQYGFF